MTDIVHPAQIKDLIAFWDFSEPHWQPRISKGAYQYALQEMNGPIQRVPGGVFNDCSVYLERGQWFRIPRAECPALNIHGKDAQVSIVAWVQRMPQPETYDCETIAGMWDESRKKRQYCLFLDLPIWDSGDQVGGHISATGAPTEGYKYCMDAAIGATPVPHMLWMCVGFTYDGEYAKAYINGMLDHRDGRNPYHYPHGIFDGGDDGADFTVGAVSRSGEPGNFFTGAIGGLAVYERALTEKEMASLVPMIVKNP